MYIFDLIGNGTLFASLFLFRSKNIGYDDIIERS